jgi:hypothetical protein
MLFTVVHLIFMCFVQAEIYKTPFSTSEMNESSTYVFRNYVVGV